MKVNESLPATSYIKMIDAWLIFNLLIPFILIMIHTYMDTLREYVPLTFHQISFLKKSAR